MLTKVKNENQETYQCIFVNDQHQTQTYRFPGLPLTQKPNCHNSNPCLLIHIPTTTLSKLESYIPEIT